MEIGRYRVGEVLGTGRTGRVRRGVRTDDGADVAVRQIPTRLLEDRDVRRSVKDLPFRCFGLRSPAIVPVLDAFEINGSVAVVEPWVDGLPLSSGLGRDGEPLAQGEVVGQLIHLLEGLQELHDRGTVHGDVRADNILLTEDGPRLVGLGLADVLGRRITTASGLGSTQSPELGDAPELTEGPATPRTDLYGLAAAYRAIVGRGPPGDAGSLARILERGCSLEAAARWPGAAAFVDALRASGSAKSSGPAQSSGSLASVGPLPSISDTFPFPSAEVDAAPVPPSTVPQVFRGGRAEPMVPSTTDLGLAEGAPDGRSGAEVPDDAPPEGAPRVPRAAPEPGKPFGTTLADYRWLLVSGGFTAIVLGLYLGVGLVRSALPDLPDGMVEVPAGSVRVGAESGSPPEVPGFEFSHERFFIDRAEVTVAQYEACVAAGECTPTTGRIEGPAPSGDGPVVGVTWLQAQSYCNDIGKRLPSENEWESAARRFGGRYGTGDEDPSCARATFARGPEDVCSATGSGPAVAAPPGDREGPVDMSGNVWEFVDADWSDTRGPGSGGASPAGGSVLKVVKGGGWSSPLGQLRLAGRLPVQNIYWAADVGFRCAKEPER